MFSSFLLVPALSLASALATAPAAAFALVAPAEDLPAPAEFAAVRARAAEAIAQGETPSLAIAVLRGGALVWAEGLGFADLGRGLRASADTSYRLASISKPLLATGLMTLVDQGLLRLDQPVNELLPGTRLRAYRGDAGDITLRMLADHTAGLSEHWSFFYGDDQPPPFEITLQRYGFAHRTPGTAYEYSNLAFGVLNQVVESTANEAWGEYLVHNVFDPLGMSHTGEGPRGDGGAGVSYRKDVAGRFLPIPDYGFDHPGASALWSSARDLIRFARLHIGGGETDGVRVLSRKSALAMQSPRAGAPAGANCGVSWFTGDTRGHRHLTHTGGMPGVSTTLMVFPDDAAAVVVLANASASGLVRGLQDDILDVLFPAAGSEGGDAAGDASRNSAAYSDADADTDTDADADTDTEAAEPAQDATGPADLAAYAGEWAGEIAHHRGAVPLTLQVDAEARTATVSFAGGMARGLQGLELKDGELRGSARGVWDGHETHQGEASLRFRLRCERGQCLAGVMTSYEARYAARPHWVELRRPAGIEVEPVAVMSYFERADAPTVGFVLPGHWKEQAPENSMRMAQYTIDDEGTACVVYFFGAGGGGGAKANLDRWAGQFETDEEPRIEERELGEDCRGTFLDVRGTFVASVVPGASERNNQPDWRMLAAVLEVPGGPLYLRLVGPAARVAAAEADFDAWTASFTRADHRR